MSLTTRRALRPKSLANALQSVVAELKTGGAAVVKTDGDRVVAVDLDKAKQLSSLLKLLHKLPDLAEVSIRNPAMDDAGMILLEGLPKLARLHLLSSGVGDKGLQSLKTLPSLRFLPLGRTKITDAGLVYLAGLTKLEYLGVRGNAITDSGLNHLEKLTNLTTLDLSQTKVTDAGLAHLKDMARLEILLLSGDNITDVGLGKHRKVDHDQRSILGRNQNHRRGPCALARNAPPDEAQRGQDRRYGCRYRAGTEVFAGVDYRSERVAERRQAILSNGMSARGSPLASQNFVEMLEHMVPCLIVSGLGLHVRKACMGEAQMSSAILRRKLYRYDGLSTLGPCSRGARSFSRIGAARV